MGERDRDEMKEKISKRFELEEEGEGFAEEGDK